MGSRKLRPLYQPTWPVRNPGFVRTRKCLGLLDSTWMGCLSVPSQGLMNIVFCSLFCYCRPGDLLQCGF